MLALSHNQNLTVDKTQSTEKKCNEYDAFFLPVIMEMMRGGGSERKKLKKKTCFDIFVKKKKGMKAFYPVVSKR